MLNHSKEIDMKLKASMAEVEKQIEDIKVNLEEQRGIAKAANAQGDRSENAEWQIAVDNIARLNSQLIELDAKLVSFKSFTSGYMPSEVIALGSTIRLYDETFDREQIIKLVPAGLGNASIGAVAVGTPVSNAVMGKKAGDTVTAKAPMGNLVFQIKEVY